MDHDLEAVVLKVGTLFVSLISVRVSLVGPFMMCIRLGMKASLVIVIMFARVEVSLRGFHLVIIQVVMVVNVLYQYSTFDA